MKECILKNDYYYDDFWIENKMIFKQKSFSNIWKNREIEQVFS